jgi:hypothetical protein
MLSTPPVMSTYPHAEAAPKPKQRVSIVWIVLGIIGVLMFVDSALGQAAQRTGVNFNGRELTKSEAKDSFREVAELARGARAGDPHSLNMGFQPQTDLGKQFKSLLSSAQKINDDYVTSISEARSPDFLAPKQLGSSDGRKDAIRIHKDYVVATMKYESETSNYLQHFSAFIGQMSGKTPSQLLTTEDENNEVWKLEKDESKSIDKMLDFVDQVQPKYDAGTNKLIFKTNDDVLKYRAFTHEIFSKQDELYTRKQEILKHRQQAISRDMADLQNVVQS